MDINEQAIRAIKARIDGEFDSIYLRSITLTTSIIEDIVFILNYYMILID